ncbi:MAG: GIY-YIG nuclease family protein [Syntrophomonadaceae bacterium]
MRKELSGIFRNLQTKLGWTNLINQDVDVNPDFARETPEEMTWDYVQANSDVILFEGLNRLKNEPYYEFGGKYPRERGNYIVSYNEMPLYIGEADNIDKRLREHYKGSTFLKNYQHKGVKLSLPPDLSMDDFRHQHMIVSWGRKDLEEFGIVNLPAPLNKFQMEKREKYQSDYIPFLWDSVQTMRSELLSQGEERLFSLQPCLWKQADITPTPGIYAIFDTDGKLIYIGESTNVYKRYLTHTTKTGFSAFRRQVATELFSSKLKTKAELGFQSNDSKKRYVTPEEDDKVTQFISRCQIRSMPVMFGRLELEEQLIKNKRPLLNRKGNKQIEDES